MDTDLQTIKNITFIRVLSLISTGTTKVRACEMCGISVSTFDRALEGNPEIASEFVVQERSRITSLYTEIMEAREKLVKKLLEETNSSTLGIRDALSIEERLRTIQGSIETELSLLPEDNKPALPNLGATNAERFLQELKGPSLKKGHSITVTTTTESIELNLTPDDTKVIDVESKNA